MSDQTASDKTQQSAKAALTVGGQAVLEGVMMRGPQAWAVAVRRPDGVIEAARHPLPRLSSRSRLANIPFIRGVLVLGESLSLGFRALSWSAQKAAGEEEEELSKGQIAGSMTIALVFFAALFIIAPAAAARALTDDRSFFYAAVEGVVQLAIFLGYLWLLGRSKEIKQGLCLSRSRTHVDPCLRGGRSPLDRTGAEVPTGASPLRDQLPPPGDVPGDLDLRIARAGCPGRC